MRVGYHPAVQRDVNAILRRYDSISGKLGDTTRTRQTRPFRSLA